MTRPSRMSASETMHSSSPKRPMTSRSTSAPPKITSWRPTGNPGRRARSDTGSPPSTSHHRRDRRRGQHRVVDPLPVVLRQPQFQAGQGRDGAGEADQPPVPPDLGQDRDRFLGPIQFRCNGLHRRRDLRRRGRVAAEEAFGQPDAADVERHGQDLLSGPGHDLGGATADVEDDDLAWRGRQVAGGAGVGQPALLRSGQQLCRHTDDVRRGDQERLSVGRVTHSGGGDKAGPAHALGIHDGAVGAQRRKRPLHRLGPQSTGGVDTLAEPGDGHLAGAHVARCARPRASGSSSCRNRPRRAHRRVPRSRVSQSVRRQGPGRVNPSLPATHAPTASSPAGQPPGHVGVKALDPLTGAPHSPARARAGPVGRYEGVALRPRSGGGSPPAPHHPPAPPPLVPRPPPRAGRRGRAARGPPASTAWASGSRRAGRARWR